MIKILIIEDESVAARKLARMLAVCVQEIEILDVIESKRDAIAKIPQSTADLILLDIHLTDGKSFDIFDKIECQIPIIFTTAYDQYTLRAFKHLSIDYLLKPIAQADLQAALNKYEQHFKAKDKEVDYHQLVELLQAPKNYKSRFLLQIGNKLKPISIEEVSYFYSEQKTTYLVVQNGRSYPIDFSLTQLENELDPSTFYRVNRQVLLSRVSVASMQYLSSTRLKIELSLKTPIDIFVSVDKIVKFKAWLK